MRSGCGHQVFAVAHVDFWWHPVFLEQVVSDFQFHPEGIPFGTLILSRLFSLRCGFTIRSTGPAPNGSLASVHWAARSSEHKKRVFQCRRGFGKRWEIFKDSAEFVRLCSKRSVRYLSLRRHWSRPQCDGCGAHAHVKKFPAIESFRQHPRTFIPVHCTSLSLLDIVEMQRVGTLSRGRGRG